MQNTLQTAWQRLGDRSHDAQFADRPRGRLVWLAGAMLSALLLIGGRLAYVQCQLPEGLIDVFEETTDSWEELPARDGRILAADGVALADNEERFDLLVYYRWIEEPADKDWLRHRAIRQLNRSERRDALRIAAAEAAVVARRDDLWKSLAELTQISSGELQSRRARIQQRVEHIWKRVDAKRRASGKPPETSAAKTSATMVQRLGDGWTRFWNELTTPPTRHHHDPLIIMEQEDEHVLLEGIDPEIAAEIDTHPERYPGTRVQVRSRRVYPQGDLAAHLIGNRTTLLAEEIAARPEAETQNLQAGDSSGRSGLERSYDEQLRGRRGLKRIVRNRRREAIQTVIVQEPRPGQDLVVTLDSNLQRRTEELLDQVLVRQPAAAEAVVDDESNRAEPAAMTGPRGACLVALDVRTGAVLAAAAAPRFDLNLLVQTDAKRWQTVLDDPRRPLFPRVTQMALPPGSIFKTLSALALVEDGELDPEARFVCQGYLDRPDKDRCLVYRHYGVGHNETNLADALCRSCNVYFFTAARHSGPRPLIDWSRKLGIGQPTGIDLPGEAAGSLPSPDANDSTSRRRWYPGDTLGLVIGQSSLLVTPLQMARLMAAVANDGQLVTPYLGNGTGQIHENRLRITGDESSGEAPPFTRPEPKPIAGLHAATLAVVREGLERVVQDRHGTAYKTVRLPNVKIAGKTGTAEVGGRLPDHAWFAGYVPADEPKVAFAVVIEHGGSGGKVAGPVAKEFVKMLLELGVIHGTSALAKE